MVDIPQNEDTLADPAVSPAAEGSTRKRRRKRSGTGSGRSRSKSSVTPRRKGGSAAPLFSWPQLSLGGIAPVLAGFLLFALLFGGGGSPAPIAELLVQIVALAVMAWAAIIGDTRFSLWAAWRRDPLLVSAGAALALIMIVQLIPLPASVWEALPGRAPIVENAAAFDDIPSLPLSIAPTLTLAALLSLLAPYGAYLLASATNQGERNWWGPALALFAVATILLEMMQLSGRFFLYPVASDSFARGFQANRNAQGDIIAIILAALACRPYLGQDRRTFTITQIACAVVLVFAAILTGSRSGLAMALALALLIGGREIWARRAAAQRRLGLIVAGSFVALAGVSVALLSNANVAALVDRFGKDQEGRTAVIWPDAWYTAQQFLPWGSGFGSFIPAFKIFESQELLDERVANRAHNELLELLIEGGYVAVGLALVALALVLWRGFTVMRQGITPHARARGAMLVLVSAVLAAHSMVDYPIRAMSIATLWAVLLGLVTADRADVLAGVLPPEIAKRKEGRTLKSNVQRQRSMRRQLTTGGKVRMVASLLAIVFVVLPATVISAFDRAERPLPANLSCVLPAPHSCRREMSEALAQAPGADISAISGPLARAYPADAAIQALHGSQLQFQNKVEGYLFLHNSARLGWREPLGQLNAFQLAANDGDIGRAVMHVDAVMRSQPELITNPGLVDNILANPAVRAEWAARLRHNPKYVDPLIVFIARSARRPANAPETENAAWQARIDFLARAYAEGLRLDPAARDGYVTVAYRGDRARAADLLGALAGQGGWPAGKPAWSVAPRSGPLAVSGQPFAWSAEPGQQGMLVVERGGGGPARFVISRSTAGTPKRLATLALFLAPGYHELTWRTKGADPDSLYPTVVCPKGGNADFDLIDPETTDMGRAAVKIEPECAAATIVISTGRAGTDPGDWIQDLEIDRKRLLE